MKTENDLEMKKEIEEMNLHRMAKVRDLLEIWQGSQNLRDTQKSSRTQNQQMTAVGYTSDTDDIVKASWSLFQHNRVAAFKLSERSALPPPLSAKDLPGERTQILDFRWIRRIDRHPIASDEDSVPESISDTEDWLDWNGELDDANDNEDDCAADIDMDIGQDNSIEDAECPEQQDVSTMPNVHGLIQPTLKSKRQAEKVFVTVNAFQTRRNKGVKKK